MNVKLYAEYEQHLALGRKKKRKLRSKNSFNLLVLTKKRSSGLKLIFWICPVKK